MGNKIISFANAFSTPGSVLAIIIAWVASRPDLQMRLEELWTKLFGHAEVKSPVSIYEPYGANVASIATARVPVSESRCKVTQAFRPIRIAMEPAG